MESDILIKLSELIEAVNKPDWWTIGITSVIAIVNLFIMAVLAWRQVTLQKAMNFYTFYAQDPDLYKAVLLVESEAKSMLVTICSILYFTKNREEYFARRINIYDNLKRNFLDKQIDLQIKANVDRSSLDTYVWILDSMSDLAKWVDEYIKAEEIISNENAFFRKFTDKVYVQNILKYIKDDRRAELKELIEKFLQLKKYMLKSPISKRML